jgi:hypothetical protein
MKIMNVVRRAGAVVAGSVVLASAAMAETTAATVTGAITEGTSTVQLVVGGVIALAALAFGLGMMKSWLSK